MGFRFKLLTIFGNPKLYSVLNSFGINIDFMSKIIKIKSIKTKFAPRILISNGKVKLKLTRKVAVWHGF
jgi:hypothetical protein